MCEGETSAQHSQHSQHSQHLQQKNTSATFATFATFLRLTIAWNVKNRPAQKGESVQKRLFWEEKWFFLQRAVIQWVTWCATMLDGGENGAKIKAMLLALNVMHLAVEVMLLYPKSIASV